jgi:glucokinase
MPALAIDLGGTKLAMALFSKEGVILRETQLLLGNRQGSEVSRLIIEQIETFLDLQEKDAITSIGICVPGICYPNTGTVWVPNIPGWEAYPLFQEIKAVTGNLPVVMDNDRACYILGEVWKGNAKNCRDAIFLAVGTGIGAGILTNGIVLRGTDDTAGAIGWMALERP